MSRRPFRSAALGYLGGALLATLTAASSAVLCAGAARAQDFTMKFATLTINDVQHEFIKMYKTELEKTTNNRIKVEVYPAGQLGSAARQAEGLRLGPPTDSNTQLGPLISAQHREKVLSYYRLAGEEGAAVITGGGVPHFDNSLDHGFFVQPTIYTGLKESARCIKEEIFGPVCHIAPFDTEEEAIAMANDTRYGLAASVWTSNLKRGHRVAQQMNVGITWVNCWFLRDLRTPFGGVGLSGIGREGGLHSLNFYSELNNVCIRI